MGASTLWPLGPSALAPAPSSSWNVLPPAAAPGHLCPRPGLTLAVVLGVLLFLIIRAQQALQHPRRRSGGS